MNSFSSDFELAARAKTGGGYSQSRFVEKEIVPGRALGGAALPEGSEHMRVVLRSTQTGHYFRIAKEWTRDDREALDFGQIEHAIKTACEARLDDVEVVFLFEHPQQLLRLPIR